MANARLIRQKRKARGGGDAKLNITSMMDMFTIILVFLLKSFSTEGQLVTPATGLTLPTSTVERAAKSGLSLKISKDQIVVEDKLVISPEKYAEILRQKPFLIPDLQSVLKEFSENAKTAAERFNKKFSGEITIQADVGIPYKLLTRVMYTCGQSGYPVMNLVVYRNE